MFIKNIKKKHNEIKSEEKDKIQENNGNIVSEEQLGSVIEFLDIQIPNELKVAEVGC